MKLRNFALATALLAAGVMPAAAQDTVIASDPAGVADALDQFGYRAESMTEGGESYISFAASGSTSRIRFFQCDDAGANCKTMLFSYGMDLGNGTTLEKVNEWNAKDLYAVVYADSDLDPLLNMTVVTSDVGIPRALFGDYLEIWDLKVGEAKDFFDF
jgi:hypothetical protein